jgi:hypothetical protein
MKKILLGLCLVAFSVQGATFSGSLTNNANSLLTAGAHISMITLIGGSSQVTVKFYDLATVATNLVTSSYSTRTSYTTNIVTSFTNTLGQIINRTNYGIFTLTSTVDAATNQAPRLAEFIVPANTMLVNEVNIQTVKGLSAFSSGDATVSVQYRTGL